MNFTLYPITWLATNLDEEPFDMNRLPFDLADGVRIERVAERFPEGSFKLWKERIGGLAIEALTGIRFALVHRYDPRQTIIGSEVYDPRVSSERLVRLVAACLQLIRPMRERAYLVHGSVQDADGSFSVRGFDAPSLELMEVPEVQKLFKLRTQDAEDLKSYVPEFLRAMRGDFWKFKTAVQFYSRGHFQSLDWTARYLLWCSAIESIYTSHEWEHQGALVATSRIKWFLGANTSIYAPGDLSDLLHDPGITIGQIVADLYELRNFIAHGDRIPNHYFTDRLREGFEDSVSRAEVLVEAASFIVRTSLIKILRDGLLSHFADAAPAEVYFRAQGLTRTPLQRLQPRN